MNNSRDSKERLAEFALGMGEMMLESGAEMVRVEDTVHRILRAGGTEAPEVFALPTGIFVGGRDRHSVTAMRRVSRRGTDLRRVSRLNQLSREFCGGKKTLKEAEEELSRIEASEKYGFPLRLLGYALTCGFFAVMFDGGIPECVAAGAVGILLCLVQEFFSRYSLSDFILVMLGSMAIGFATLGTQRLILPSLEVSAVVSGAIMPLVPGATLTTGIRDTINGDYSAGVARVAEAVVVALAVATGMAAAMVAFRL